MSYTRNHLKKYGTGGGYGLNTDYSNWNPTIKDGTPKSTDTSIWNPSLAPAKKNSIASYDQGTFNAKDYFTGTTGQAPIDYSIAPDVGNTAPVQYNGSRQPGKGGKISGGQIANYAAAAANVGTGIAAASQNPDSGVEDYIDPIQEGVAQAIPLAGLFHGISEAGQGIAASTAGSDPEKQAMFSDISGYLFEPHKLLTKLATGETEVNKYKAGEAARKQALKASVKAPSYNTAFARYETGGAGGELAELERDEIIERADGTNEKIGGKLHRKDAKPNGNNHILNGGDYVWSRKFAPKYAKAKSSSEVEKLRMAQEKWAGRLPKRYQWGGGPEVDVLDVTDAKIAAFESTERHTAIKAKKAAAKKKAVKKPFLNYPKSL